MTLKPIILGTSLLAFVPSFAYAQNRDANLESACADSGSGMDPRCVGDTSPGTVSDSTSARQERLMQHHASAPSYRWTITR
jgi:hypothetical protein